MKPEIQQMLAEAYELEGLLLLVENRGEETSDLIYETIKEKIDNLHALLQRKLRNGNEYASEPIGVTGLDLMHTVTEVDPRAFDGEDIAPFEPTHPCADEQIFESESELEGMPLFADGKTPETEVQETTTSETPADDGMAVEDERDEEASNLIETETQPAELPEDATTSSYPEKEDDAPFDAAWEDEESPIEANDENDTVRLDEILSRNLSKDLRSAFSLNDTFRFRRELFANNAADMTDAIHLVEAMKSFTEAEEYFYDDLGWDKDSEEVKAFMTIIKNHFL